MECQRDFSDALESFCKDTVEMGKSPDTNNTQQKEQQFSNPVYKQLSRINGKINRMTREELIVKLKELHLTAEGMNNVLRKRLKTYFKEQKLMQAEICMDKNVNCPYSYLCVVDFEATCDVYSNYVNEIIEFPAILIDTTKKAVVAEFHEYCQPVVKPKLTEFCKELTGITQEDVDSAETFPVVLSKFNTWLKKYNLGTGNSFTIVTDGSYDMGRFLVSQCELSGIPFPSFGKKWINIKKLFSNFYKTNRYPIIKMLNFLGMEFEGHQHCGRDDAQNIARIMIQVLKDGARVVVNERIMWNSLPSKVSNSGYFCGAEPEHEVAKESVESQKVCDCKKAKSARHFEDDNVQEISSNLKSVDESNVVTQDQNGEQFSRSEETTPKINSERTGDTSSSEHKIILEKDQNSIQQHFTEKSFSDCGKEEIKHFNCETSSVQQIDCNSEPNLTTNHNIKQQCVCEISTIKFNSVSTKIESYSNNQKNSVPEAGLEVNNIEQVSVHECCVSESRDGSVTSFNNKNRKSINCSKNNTEIQEISCNLKERSKISELNSKKECKPVEEVSSECKRIESYYDNLEAENELEIPKEEKSVQCSVSDSV